MGMSASQARFLGLTARKTNVEFQGQQVNQQRTTLANESAGLFNQMLALQVPTPPSATDFYSMSYTFPGDAANEECRIFSWATSSQPLKGAYDVEVKKTINDVGVKTPNMEIGTLINMTIAQNEGDEPSYSIAIPTADGTVNYNLEKSSKDVNGKNKGDNGYIPSYSYERGGKTYFIATSLLTEMFGDKSADYDVTENNGVKTAKITNANKEAATESYYKGTPTSEMITYTGVTMETDETGRFTAMKYYNDNGEQVEKTLVIQEINDEEGYAQAMEEYKYKKMMYDRTIDDINTRTEVIQQQDKTLELHLKQLDTEQEAIQTEMDSVKKVIEKNIEGSFKTFA